MRLEGGFERGGRIRVAECLRQIVPDSWASIRKRSFTKCFCVYKITSLPPYPLPPLLRPVPNKPHGFSVWTLSIMFTYLQVGTRLRPEGAQIGSKRVSWCLSYAQINRHGYIRAINWKQKSKLVFKLRPGQPARLYQGDKLEAKKVLLSHKY